MRVALLEHLDDEEQHILPIAARCVTQEEWNELGQHGIDKVTKAQLPLMFGALLEEATPEERKPCWRWCPSRYASCCGRCSPGSTAAAISPVRTP